MEKQSGINDVKIDKLVLDIYDINEKIRKTLDQISETMDRTSSVWKSSDAKLFRDAYDNFKTNYNIITKNISSYSEDFTKLKNSYNAKDTEMAKKVNLYMINIDETFGVKKYDEHK